MTVLLWQRRRQIGSCLLIQACCLMVGLAVEQRINLPLPPSPEGPVEARTRE